MAVLNEPTLELKDDDAPLLRLKKERFNAALNEGKGILGNPASVFEIGTGNLVRACCEMGRYFFALAWMRRSLFKSASSRKRSWS